MATVIFDLDGTLADTSGDLIAAANSCFRALGFGDVLDPVKDMATAFAGGRAMLRLGYERLGPQVDENRVSQKYEDLIAFYKQNICHHTTVYPGVEQALIRLLEDGYKLGICTNKPEGLADTLLRELGLRPYFGSLVAADTYPKKKPDPYPYEMAVRNTGGRIGRSVLIGDTLTDRDTARAAQVPIVLVGFGPFGQKIKALEPDVLLDHFDDLSAVVSRLIGPANKPEQDTL